MPPRVAGTAAVPDAAAPRRPAARDAALSEQRAAALRPLLPGVVLRPDLTRAANDDACDICTGAIKSLEEYISDPQTQASFSNLYFSVPLPQNVPARHLCEIYTAHSACSAVKWVRLKPMQ